MRDFFGFERLVAGEEVFVFPSGEGARIEAELAKQFAVAEVLADNANGADDAGRVGIDFIR